MGALVDFLQQYHSIDLSEYQLPEDIHRRYSVCACLKATECKQVYLVRREEDGKKYVMKCSFNAKGENLQEEYLLHKSLNHKGLVRAIEYIQKDNCSYFVRDYVEGNTITELLEMTKNGYLSDSEIIHITVQLCQVLHFLHVQKPPIIHRDIKPDNVIITKSGDIKLIDFGISRRFIHEQEKDTFIMGTEFSAPPEQYGFRQTDARSDIYSLGVLMFYMATGSLDIRELSDFTLTRHIKKCIQRCTKFAPKDRFSTVKQLEHSLIFENLIYKKKRLVQFVSASLMILTAFLFGCLLTMKYYNANVDINTLQSAEGQNSSFIQEDSEETVEEQKTSQDNLVADTDNNENLLEINTFDDSDSKNQEYTFQSSLIEAAVRDELGISDTDVITVADLQDITQLYICGEQIYHSWDDHFVYGKEQYMHSAEYISSGLYKVKGDISTLEDLAYMSNLNILALYHQNISDLSSLSNLKKLKILGLGANRIEDLTPLKELPDLQTLDVSGNDIRNNDLTAISEMDNLIRLDLGATRVTSLDAIKHMQLQYLSVYDDYVMDCEGLEEMTALEEFITTGLGNTITEEALLRIGTLQNLKNLNIMGGNYFDLSVLSNLTSLSCLDLCGCKYVKVEELNLPGLDNLLVDCIPDLDLTGIEENTNLSSLSIRDSDCRDYASIFKITGLKQLNCNSAQADEIKEQFAEIPFEITMY